MRISSIAIALAMAVLVSCQPPKPVGPAGLSTEDRAAIEAATRAWGDAVRAKNWSGVAALYAADAILMPPNSPAVTGREAIEAMLSAFPPLQRIELKIVEIDGLGDLAFVRGTYTLAFAVEGAPPVTDSGKWLEIHRKQADGSWLTVRDIYSSDLPPPVPVVID